MRSTPAEIPCPGPEELAVLLEGGLRLSRRHQLLEHIGACEACYEIFTGSARFLLEERARTSEPVSHLAARERWAPKAAVAAGLAAAAAVAMVLSGPAADRWRGPAGMVRQAASIDLSAVEARDPLHPWSHSRGAAGAAGDWRSAFRLGVELTDLAVAAHAGNSEAAHGSLEELRRMARTMEIEGASLDGLFEGLAGEEVVSPVRAFVLARERIGGHAEWIYVRLGAWAEAGRLAAVAEDARYFRRPGALRPPEGVDGLELPEGPAAVLRSGLEALAEGADLTPAELDAVFGRLIAGVGRYASMDA